MAHDLHHDPETDCVYLTVDGVFNVGVLKEIAPKVARLCREKHCRLILNDMSAARIEVSVLDAFDSPRLINEATVGRDTKRALVLPADFAESQFLENVSRNRGHNLKVFHDRERALDWLLKRKIPVENPPDESPERTAESDQSTESNRLR